MIAVAGDPLPPISYATAVTAAFVTATAAAAVPALWAANRDPLTELRVP